MQYKVLDVKRYTANAAGEPFQGGTRTVLTLEGVQGTPSFFDKHGAYANLAPGGSISGTLVQKGKFTNFDPSGAPSAPQGQNSSNTSTAILQKLDEILALLRKPVVDGDYESMGTDVDVPF